MRHPNGCLTEAEADFAERYKAFIRFYKDQSSMPRGIRDPVLIPKKRDEVFRFGKKRGLAKARMDGIIQEIVREIL